VATHCDTDFARAPARCVEQLAAWSSSLRGTLDLDRDPRWSLLSAREIRGDGERDAPRGERARPASDPSWTRTRARERKRIRLRLDSLRDAGITGAQSTS
jgi:hypothetical protein